MFFRKQTAEADKIVRASYDVSRVLARWMKPFSDGDFIKECHAAVVDSVCPEQRSVCETVLKPFVPHRSSSHRGDVAIGLCA